MAIASARQTLDWLEGALDDLQPAQREVLLLTALVGLRQQDVAQALDLPLNTVKTHLRRARLALAARLAEPDGPEIVIVLPADSSGWLEQSTMDVLRTRLLRCVKQADAHGRLLVRSPVVVGDGEPADVDVYVHAKAMVIDDVLARPEHSWFRKGDAESMERIRREMQRRYGQGGNAG